MRRCYLTQRGLLVSFIIFVFSAASPASTLVLTWLPNFETDLAGYKIYYGTKPRHYSDVIDVGLVTTFEFDFLADNVQYYFAVSAYDSWYNESSLSLEVSGMPAVGEIVPTEITLYHNYPNPFLQHTSFQFDLPAEASIELSIYDSIGRLVKRVSRQNGTRGANEPISWDGKDWTGRDVPSGNYFCRITSEEHRSNMIQLIRIR